MNCHYFTIDHQTDLLYNREAVCFLWDRKSMHTLTWEKDYLYWKDERAQPLNFQRNKFSLPFVVFLSLFLSTCSHCFFFSVCLFLLPSTLSLCLFSPKLIFIFNFRIYIFCALTLRLSAQNPGDFCVFTISSLCKVCPSPRCA